MSSEIYRRPVDSRVVENAKGHISTSAAAFSPTPMRLVGRPPDRLLIGSSHDRRCCNGDLCAATGRLGRRDRARNLDIGVSVQPSHSGIPGSRKSAPRNDERC
jgi:hypothetical protein